MDLTDLLRARVGSLLTRIEDHQWDISTFGLLEDLNAARSLSKLERSERIKELLQPHIGRLLFLARTVVKDFRRNADNEASQMIANILDSMLAANLTSPDGLSEAARLSLQLGLAGLVDVMDRDLDAGPLTEHRLRLLLAGRPGAHAIGSLLIEPIMAILSEGSINE